MMRIGGEQYAVTKSVFEAWLNGDITIEDLTVTGTMTVGGASTFNSTSAFNGANTYYSGSLAAVGSNQSAAAQIVADFTNVTGADGTKGVKLPVVSTGRSLVISNTDNTNTLKVYPPIGGKINRGTANAAIIVQPNSTFVLVGDLESTTDYSTIGYTSYGTTSVAGDDNTATVNAQSGLIHWTGVSITGGGAPIKFTLSNTFLKASPQSAIVATLIEDVINDSTAIPQLLPNVITIDGQARFNLYSPVNDVSGDSYYVSFRIIN